MGFVVQEFSTHLCSHVCRGRCQNSSDPLGIVCTLMKITSLHRFTLLWFQKQTNLANLLSRLIVYTISVSKAFEEGVYNVSWYSSDKFLEYAWSHQRQDVCIFVCVSVRSRGLVLRQVCFPKDCWAEQCLPTSSTHATLSLGSMKGDEPTNDSSRTPHSWH